MITIEPSCGSGPGKQVPAAAWRKENLLELVRLLQEQSAYPSQSSYRGSAIEAKTANRRKLRCNPMSANWKSPHFPTLCKP
jgi:hypothetical protein